MATQEEYKINISPTQLMVFTFAMVALMMAMAFIITNTVVNGQAAHAANQTNTAPQYLVTKDGTGVCSEPTAEEATVVGDHVVIGGEIYKVVGVVPGNNQVNEDNDTTINRTTTVDNRFSGNTTSWNNGNTDVNIHDNGNTDNRNSGNTSVDNRNSGNTTTDNRNSGNTNTSVDIRNNGNTTTDNRNSGNTSVDNRNSGNTTTNNNQNNSNQGNTTNSGNTNVQNNGNTTEDNDTVVILP